MDTKKQLKKTVQELLEEIKKELDPRIEGMTHWRSDNIGTVRLLPNDKGIMDGFRRGYKESAAMRLKKYIARAQELRQEYPELQSLKDIINATYASDMGVQRALQLFQEWCLETQKAIEPPTETSEQEATKSGKIPGTSWQTVKEKAAKIGRPREYTDSKLERMKNRFNDLVGQGKQDSEAYSIVADEFTIKSPDAAKKAIQRYQK